MHSPHTIIPHITVTRRRAWAMFLYSVDVPAVQSLRVKVWSSLSFPDKTSTCYMKKKNSNNKQQLIVLSHQELRKKAKNFLSWPKYSIISLLLVSNIKIMVEWWSLCKPQEHKVQQKHNSSAVHGDEWSTSHPGYPILKDRTPITHWTGGYIGTRAILVTLERRQIACPHQKLNHYSSAGHPMAMSLYQLRYLAPLQFEQPCAIVMKDEA
jgi:hypothetical protein